MGIEGYHKWINKRFAGCVRPATQPDTVHHVYVDMNSLVHVAGRKAKNERDFTVKVFRQLDRLFKLAIPTKSIYLACDGPAPMAKLLTQRMRRIKAASKKKRSKVDSLQFTPGTEFMMRFKNALAFYAASRLQNDRKYANVAITVDGSDVPGEGEVKLINQMLGHYAANPNDSFLVVGGDADLILLAVASGVPSVSVLIETSGGRDATNVCFSVAALYRSFDALEKGCAAAMRLDFILISLMMGNDYLPKLRGANMDRCWTTYQSLRKGRFQGQFLLDHPSGTFNWPFLLNVLGVWRKMVPPPGAAAGAAVSAVAGVPAIAPGAHPENDEEPEEEEEPEEKAEKKPRRERRRRSGAGSAAAAPEKAPREPKGKRELIEGEEDGEGDEIESEDDEEDDESSESSESEEAADDRVIGFSSDPNAPRSNVRAYLEGLLWCLHMYADGRCPDYAWFYAYPWAPSGAQLRDWDFENVQVPRVLETRPLSPVKCLMTLLPAAGKQYVPTYLQPLMDPTSEVGDIYYATDHRAMEIGRLLTAIDAAAAAIGDMTINQFGVPVVFQKDWGGRAQFIPPALPEGQRELFRPYKLMQALVTHANRPHLTLVDMACAACEFARVVAAFAGQRPGGAGPSGGGRGAGGRGDGRGGRGSGGRGGDAGRGQGRGNRGAPQQGGGGSGAPRGGSTRGWGPAPTPVITSGPVADAPAPLSAGPRPPIVSFSPTAAAGGSLYAQLALDGAPASVFPSAPDPNALPPPTFTQRGGGGGGRGGGRGGGGRGGRGKR